MNLIMINCCFAYSDEFNSDKLLFRIFSFPAHDYAMLFEQDLDMNFSTIQSESMESLLLRWVNFMSNDASELLEEDGTESLDNYLPKFVPVTNFSSLKDGQQLIRIIVNLLYSLHISASPDQKSRNALGRATLENIKSSCQDPPKLIELVHTIASASEFIDVDILQLINTEGVLGGDQNAITHLLVQLMTCQRPSARTSLLTQYAELLATYEKLKDYVDTPIPDIFSNITEEFLILVGRKKKASVLAVKCEEMNTLSESEAIVDLESEGAEAISNENQPSNNPTSFSLENGPQETTSEDLVVDAGITAPTSVVDTCLDRLDERPINVKITPEMTSSSSYREITELVDQYGKIQDFDAILLSANTFVKNLQLLSKLSDQIDNLQKSRNHGVAITNVVRTKVLSSAFNLLVKK